MAFGQRKAGGTGHGENSPSGQPKPGTHIGEGEDERRRVGEIPLWTNALWAILTFGRKKEKEKRIRFWTTQAGYPHGEESGHEVSVFEAKPSLDTS